MKVEVLVASMNQNNFDLVEKMNLQSNAVIANQCDFTSFETTEINNNVFKLVSTTERGVGKNRNVALLYATDDILLIADDDMVYVDGYQQSIVDAFEKTPKADIIVFNLTEDSGRKMITKKHRVRFFNSMRYGAVRLAIKKSSLDKANIWFSMLYGGGAKFSSGEDSLFIRQCMKSGLKIYAIPDILARLLNDRPSTWDNGDFCRQAYDKGILLKNAFPNSAFILKYVFAFKLKRKELRFLKALKLIKKGIRDFKNLKTK